MHKLSIMAVLLAMAAGCSTVPSGSSSSSSSSNSTDSGSMLGSNGDCDASGVQSYVGRSWSDSLESDLLRASSSRSIRVVKPGQVMTMEFNPTRLNAVLNAQGNIDSLHCG